MSWLIRGRWCGVALLAVVAGCSYGTGRPDQRERTPIGPTAGALDNPGVVVDPAAPQPKAEVSDEIAQRRSLIINNVVKHIQQAGEKPGGQDFAMATESLNELFEGSTEANDFNLSPEGTLYLGTKIRDLTGEDPTEALKVFSSRKFTIRDARHIEDCMLYHALAARVAGEGDDLTRVRRLFDWLTRNIQLVPAGSLTVPGLRQAEARPADVLTRGMATEAGAWSERGWLFLSLCRQIGIDAGLLTYTPRRALFVKSDGPPPVLPWVIAALVGDKAYLFDQRTGLEIPNLDGSGVATLDEVIAHPEILDRLDVPESDLPRTTAADLANSPSKVGILVDSSVGYMAPRMRLLQAQLRGEYRTVLFRDPLEQAKHFAVAFGPYFGRTQLWRLPLEVEQRLFSDSKFVAATQASLVFFDSKFPLLLARSKQLHGDLAEAVNQFAKFRFAEHPVTRDGKETPIPREQQRGLDVYATYFLAQSHYDQGHIDQADYLFRQMLAQVPEPGPGRYFYYMMRWGALNNLGRIAEARGQVAEAIAFYTTSDQGPNGYVTPQHVGNLLRARRLAWANPMSEPASPLPPAPADPSSPSVAVETPQAATPAP